MGIFERASLQSCKVRGGDFRGASFKECNLGRCDFTGCRIVDEELQDAVDKEAALLKLRIASPHFCGHCGKNRGVWGTRVQADAHHAKMHPELPLNSVPISIEDGCRHISVAVETGQAA